MAKKPSLSINPYTGLVEYNGPTMIGMNTIPYYGTDVLEFIREDIEQICSVILDDADLNVMRLKQYKWKWWYSKHHISGSHYIKLQYRQEPDSPIIVIGKNEAELLRSFIEPIKDKIASYKDFE